MSAYYRLYDRMPRRIHYSAKTDLIGYAVWALVVALLCIAVIVFAAPRTGWAIALMLNVAAIIGGLYEFSASSKEDELRQYGDIQE